MSHKPWCAALLQGPNLGGLFGRQSGTMDGFSYSKANKEKAVHWDENTLYDYLLAPKKYIPGEVLAGCWTGQQAVSSPVESVQTIMVSALLPAGLCRDL